MSKSALVQKLEERQLRQDIPAFNVGDTVSVDVRIIEGGKERIQVFTGTVIARKGYGLSETFTLHRIAYGEGMERVFLLHSPRVAKIELVRKGKARRAKLYNLRGKYGKAAKVKGLYEGRRKVQKPVTKVSTAKKSVEAKATGDSSSAE
ncbi:MAG: 50S ribosomal protein L19 [Chlamydiota bacterium]